MNLFPLPLTRLRGALDDGSISGNISPMPEVEVASRRQLPRSVWVYVAAVAVMLLSGVLVGGGPASLAAAGLLLPVLLLGGIGVVKRWRSAWLLAVGVASMQSFGATYLALTGDLVPPGIDSPMEEVVIPVVAVTSLVALVMPSTIRHVWHRRDSEVESGSSGAYPP